MGSGKVRHSSETRREWAIVLDSSASQPKVAAVVNWLLSVEEMERREGEEGAGDEGDFGG